MDVVTGHVKPVAPMSHRRGDVMKKIVTTRYDVAEHLRTPEEMAAYLETCIEESNGDAAFIAKALGDIARAKGMSQVARDAGLREEGLNRLNGLNGLNARERRKTVVKRLRDHSLFPAVGLRCYEGELGFRGTSPPSAGGWVRAGQGRSHVDTTTVGLFREGAAANVRIRKAPKYSEVRDDGRDKKNDLTFREML